MIGLTFFVAALADQANEPVVDGPPLDWATDHAPNGMDITLDGKLWINANPVGARNDYAILANDLYDALTAKNSRPKVWVRGYHARNKDVAYRESKTLVTIDCIRKTFWIEREIRYDAEGRTLDSLGPYAEDPIAPGSVAESWQKFTCPR